MVVDSVTRMIDEDYVVGWMKVRNLIVELFGATASTRNEEDCGGGSRIRFGRQMVEG